MHGCSCWLIGCELSASLQDHSSSLVYVDAKMNEIKLRRVQVENEGVLGAKMLSILIHMLPLFDRFHINCVHRILISLPLHAFSFLPQAIV